jgi:hypothetical protein
MQTKSLTILILDQEDVPLNVKEKTVFFADSELTKGGSRSGEQLLANRPFL